MFYNDATTKSSLEYVTVEYAGSNLGGIRISNSSPTIRNSTISNNANAGIYIYRGDAFPEITDSIISGNATYGIYHAGGVERLTITGSDFHSHPISS